MPAYHIRYKESADPFDPSSSAYSAVIPLKTTKLFSVSKLIRAMTCFHRLPPETACDIKICSALQCSPFESVSEGGKYVFHKEQLHEVTKASPPRVIWEGRWQQDQPLSGADVKIDWWEQEIVFHVIPTSFQDRQEEKYSITFEFEDDHRPPIDYPVSISTSLHDIVDHLKSILPSDYDFDLSFKGKDIFNGLRPSNLKKTCPELNLIQSSVIIVHPTFVQVKVLLYEYDLKSIPEEGVICLPIPTPVEYTYSASLSTTFEEIQEALAEDSGFPVEVQQFPHSPTSTVKDIFPRKDACTLSVYLSATKEAFWVVVAATGLSKRMFLVRVHPSSSVSDINGAIASTTSYSDFSLLCNQRSLSSGIVEDLGIGPGSKLRCHVRDPSQRGEGMMVFIKTIEGMNLTVKVEPKTTISELRDRIERYGQISIDQQRLLFAGKRLEDPESTLYFWNVGKESTIDLVIPLRGGMYHPISARDDFQAFLRSSPDPVVVSYFNPYVSGNVGKVVIEWSELESYEEAVEKIAAEQDLMIEIGKLERMLEDDMEL